MQYYCIILYCTIPVILCNIIYYNIMNSTMNKQRPVHEMTIGKQLLSKYHDKIPIIVETNNFSLLKKKFLVPGDATLGYVALVVRKHSDKNLKSVDAIYMFIDNKLPCMTDTVSDAYIKHKNNTDDCLHILLTKENTFGCG